MIDDPRQSMIGELGDEDYLLSGKAVLRVLWRRWWIVVLAAAVIVGIAVGYSLWQTPQYQATTTVLVGQKSDLLSSPQNALGLQQVATTVSVAAESRPVAEGTIQRLGLHMAPETLLANLSVEVVEATPYVKLTYTDSDPERAPLVANAVGDVLFKRISEVGPGPNAITATLWEKAQTPSGPVSPNPLRTGLLALIIGTMLGVGLAFLLEHLDDSWRSPEEVEQILGVPNFGAIPYCGTSRNGKRARAEIGRD
jgi:capsular polysaccharide biosynthesis protein